MPSYGKRGARNGLGVALLAAALCFGMLVCAGGGTARAAKPHDVAEIVRRVEAVSRIPSHVRMLQSVNARAFLFNWRFTSVLEYVGDELTATTEGAPSFVPDTFPVDLASLGRMLSIFDLELIDDADENGYLVLQGPRPDYDGRGVQEATFMIDPSDWLVKRASAKYDWGTLNLEQEFDSFNGFVLLRRQKATVRPYGFVVDVEYSDYSLVSAKGADRPPTGP